MNTYLSYSQKQQDFNITSHSVKVLISPIVTEDIIGISSANSSAYAFKKTLIVESGIHPHVHYRVTPWLIVTLLPSSKI